MNKFFFLFFISTTIYALNCSQHIKIEYRENNQIKTITHKMCVLNKGEAFISSSCLKKCLAKITGKSSKLDIKEGQGSPDHLRCHRYGGNPMISTLTYKNKKISTTLCLFKDGSMGTLDLIRSLHDK